MNIRRRKDSNRSHAWNWAYLQNLPENLLPAGCGQTKSWSFVKSEGLSMWGWLLKAPAKFPCHCYASSSCDTGPGHNSWLKISVAREAKCWIQGRLMWVTSATTVKKQGIAESPQQAGQWGITSAGPPLVLIYPQDLTNGMNVGKWAFCNKHNWRCTSQRENSIESAPSIHCFLYTNETFHLSI